MDSTNLTNALRHEAQATYDEATRVVAQKRKALDSHQAELGRAIGADERATIDQAPDTARARFDADARAKAAGRHLRAAQANLEAAGRALDEARSTARKAALEAVAPEVRAAVSECLDAFACWQACMARVAGAGMLDVLPTLTDEQWRGCTGGNIPTLLSANVSPPAPPVGLLGELPDSRSLRAAAFRERDRWAAHVAQFEDVSPPKLEADFLIATRQMVADALRIAPAARVPLELRRPDGDCGQPLARDTGAVRF